MIGRADDRRDDDETTERIRFSFRLKVLIGIDFVISD